MSIQPGDGLMQAEIRPGQSFPLGAMLYPDGVNFSVYSKNATGIDLLLFAELSDPHGPPDQSGPGNQPDPPRS